jgi:hypothetical protein
MTEGHNLGSSALMSLWPYVRQYMFLGGHRHMFLDFLAEEHLSVSCSVLSLKWTRLEY